MEPEENLQQTQLKLKLIFPKYSKTMKNAIQPSRNKNFVCRYFHFQIIFYKNLKLYRSLHNAKS